MPRAGTSAHPSREPRGGGGVDVAASTLLTPPALLVRRPLCPRREAFLATVPVKEHRAWSQRIKGMVVDGSPQWQVFHSLPLTAEAAPQQASSSISLGGQPQQAKSAAGANDGQLLLDLGAILSYPSVVGGGSAPGVNDSNSWMAGPAGAAASSKPSADAASGKPDAKDSTASGDAVLDWKGEPMKINPGDKLPFKFL